MSDSLDCSMPGFPESSIPGVYSNSCPSSQWCHPAVSTSVTRFSSYPQSFPTSRSFQWVSSSHQMAKVSEFQLQHQSFQCTFRIDSFRIDWFDLAVQRTLKCALSTIIVISITIIIIITLSTEIITEYWAQQNLVLSASMSEWYCWYNCYWAI